uniref:Phosphohydrolase n=1 Tax=Pseudomonas phage RVTF4 TaxID=3236931 RepID=A0AB39CCZ8_9VIRU
MHPLVAQAETFCLAAHAAVGQLRKYTNKDYHTHPFAVRDRLKAALGDRCTPEMECGALLHDVIEDTSVKRRIILDTFGFEVLRIVMGLSDSSTKDDGSRKHRKAIDRAHIANQPWDVQTIKACDLIDNMESIEKHDLGFAKVYVPEKRLILDVLVRAEPKLLERCWQLVTDFEKKHGTE